MKKYAKSLLALLSAMTLLFSLIACSSEPATSQAEENAPAPAEEEVETVEEAVEASENFYDSITPLDASVFPLSEEKATLSILTRGFTDITNSVTERWIYQEYEEMTNVEVDWTEIPRASWNEQFSIVMATGDYPEVIYGGFIPTADLSKYGGDGIFLPLNEYIKNSSAGIATQFKNNTNWLKMSVDPSGNVYGLPYLNQSKFFSSAHTYINHVWLENLGLEVPTTLAEYEEVLYAFKEQDANGNGDPNDEFPIYDQITRFEQWMVPTLYGSFGLGTMGRDAAVSMFIDEAPDGSVRFIPATEEYKELMMLFNKWYTDGLMHPDNISGVEFAQWQSDAQLDLVGSWSSINTQYIGANIAQNWTGLRTLPGEDGQALINLRTGVSPGCFVITEKCENPELAFKWVDYFYTDEGSKFLNLGIEGETYTLKDDGLPLLTEEIRSHPEGAQVGAMQLMDNIWGGGKGMLITEDWNDSSFGYEEEDILLAYGGVWYDDGEEFYPESLWPAQFPATQEENDELLGYFTDITNFVNESRSKFITGQMSFDEWDSYIETLNEMGLEDYLALREFQAERYDSVVG